jgi:hypothetical protein
MSLNTFCHKKEKIVFHDFRVIGVVNNILKNIFLQYFISNILIIFSTQLNLIR